MRPTKLTMKAFGSYGGQQTVDFESFTGGLYLIVGKTGAGKTTIFDAICFALFGCPSGSDRTYAMLHSDYVPKSEDTVVTLEFVHQGRTYRIERSLHFRKDRATGQYLNCTVKAELQGPNGEAVNGATPVTARCEELLGLNVEQFRRIVMLAQGEFREFLRAGSAEKNEILGRLFDNSEYVRFQNLLAGARDSLLKRRGAWEAEIAAVMKTLFQAPEDPALAEDFLPGHPRLEENLQALTDREAAKLQTLQQENETRNREVELLARREGAAQADNALFDELSAKRARLAELEDQAEAYAAQQDAYAAAEKALHRVRPKEIERARAAADVEKARAEIEKLTHLSEEQRAALERAQTAAAADAPKRERAEVLAGEAAKLHAALPRYVRASDQQDALTREQRLLEETAASAQKQALQQTELAETIAQIRGELSSLEGCEAQAVLLANERDAARVRRDAVAAPGKGIRARVEAILAEAGALDMEKAVLHRLTREAAEAERRYHQLYQSFLEGQAGLIASQMERELDETGRTVCPVCSTHFSRSELHRFAVPTDAVPDRAQVTEAEKAAKTAEDQRQRKQVELERRASLLEQRKDDAAEQMRALDPACTGWGALTAPGWLPALCARLERALAEREQALAAARDRCERRAQLLALEKDKTGEQQALADRLQEKTKRVEELRRRIHGLESALAETRSLLPYPTEVEARKKLHALNGEKDALQRLIESRETALKQAKEDLDLTAGAQTALLGALPAQTQALRDAEAALAQALRATGFADPDAANAALRPIGDADGERWLLRQKEALDGYARDQEQTRSRIEELTARTAGKTRTDLTALQLRLEEARQAQSAGAKALSAQEQILSGHRTVLEKVCAARTELRRTDAAWQRISRLAELAVGVSGEGGKLSFDRYVMGTIFREVLEMANRRLSVMTGGRFELVHSVDAGRKNAVAGLEINVLDVALGTQRPASSVSGGEGFMVSLALALGLSDVVQNHAGGQKLDALFIDEGFGSLDVGKLDNVITVLKQLTEGNRLVGVISHVDQLEASIPQKLRVSSTRTGSALIPELS